MSRVWDYFGFPAKNRKFLEPDKKKQKQVNCKLFPRDFSYVGNTTNMWQHLKESHPGHFREGKPDESSPRCASATNVTRVADTEMTGEIDETETSSQFVSSSSHQLRVPLLFKSQLPLAHTSSCWKTITDLVCYFIAKGMHPFQTVNEPGFRKLLHVMESRYEPPDRKTLASNHMCKMYEKERERVLDNLVNADNYSVNADFWTSCQN